MLGLHQYKCGGCDKKRSANRFSKNTLRKWESSKREANIKNNVSLIRLPRCTDCSGTPRQELQCSHCAVTKSLDDFSKQQRKNPDNALCFNCSQDKQDLEPVHLDQVQEEATIDRLRMGATASDLMTGGSTHLSYNANSLPTARSGNIVTTSTDFDGASNWINAPVPIPDDPRARSAGASYPGAPSAVSNASHDTATNHTAWSSFERTNAPFREQAAARRSGSDSGSSRGNNPGFVKQGAVKQDPTLKAEHRFQREQNTAQAREEQAQLHEDDSDDDDDDDDEDPY